MGTASQILGAIDLIVQQKISELEFDKTIKATILECSNLATGEYKVRYQDSTLTAYAKYTTIAYQAGDFVYILVPANNFSARKTITGMVIGAENSNPMAGWFKNYDPTMSNEPAISWLTDDTKDVHLGDIFYNVESGQGWVFVNENGVEYKWYPLLIDAMEVQYSITGAGVLVEGSGTPGFWHPEFEDGIDFYRRERIGTGVWQGPIRIVGIDGTNGTNGSKGDTGNTGDYTVVVYTQAPETAVSWDLTALTIPNPSGTVAGHYHIGVSSYNTTWDSTPPTTTGINVVWVARGLFDSADTLKSWLGPNLYKITADKIKANVEISTPIIHSDNMTLAFSELPPASGGSGFWLGKDGTTNKLSIGNTTNNIKWDGTGLSVKGGTVTGAIIQTAATGGRVQIDTDGIYPGIGGSEIVFYIDDIELIEPGGVYITDSYGTFQSNLMLTSPLIDSPTPRSSYIALRSNAHDESQHAAIVLGVDGVGAGIVSIAPSAQNLTDYGFRSSLPVFAESTLDVAGVAHVNSVLVQTTLETLGVATFTGDAAIGAKTAATDTTHAGGYLEINGTFKFGLADNSKYVYWNNATLEILGAATISTTLSVTGLATFSAAATIGTTLGVTGVSTLTGGAGIGTKTTSADTTHAGAYFNADGTFKAGLANNTKYVQWDNATFAITGILAVTGSTTISTTLGVTGISTLTGGAGIGTKTASTDTTHAGAYFNADGTCKFGLANNTKYVYWNNATLAVVGIMAVTGSATVSTTLGVTGISTLTGGAGVGTKTASTDTTHAGAYFNADGTCKFGLANNTKYVYWDNATLAVVGAMTVSTTFGVTGVSTFTGDAAIGAKTSGADTTHAGGYLEADGTFKFGLADNTHYVSWDNTTLNVVGNITALNIQAGSWTKACTSGVLYYTDITFAPAFGAGVVPVVMVQQQYSDPEGIDTSVSLVTNNGFRLYLHAMYTTDITVHWFATSPTQ